MRNRWTIAVTAVILAIAIIIGVTVFADQSKWASQSEAVKILDNISTTWNTRSTYDLNHEFKFITKTGDSYLWDTEALKSYESNFKYFRDFFMWSYLHQENVNLDGSSANSATLGFNSLRTNGIFKSSALSNHFKDNPMSSELNSKITGTLGMSTEAFFTFLCSDATLKVDVFVSLLNKFSGKNYSYDDAFACVETIYEIEYIMYQEITSVGTSTQDLDLNARNAIEAWVNSADYKSAKDCNTAMNNPSFSGYHDGSIPTKIRKDAVTAVLKKHNLEGNTELNDFVNKYLFKDYTDEANIKSFINQWRNLTNVGSKGDPTNPTEADQHVIELTKICQEVDATIVKNCAVCHGSGKHEQLPPDPTITSNLSAASVELHYEDSAKVKSYKGKESIAGTVNNGVRFPVYSDCGNDPDDDYSFLGSSTPEAPVTPAKVAAKRTLDQGSANGNINNLLDRFYIYTAGLIYSNSNNVVKHEDLVNEDSNGAFAKVDADGDDVMQVWLDMAYSGLTGLEVKEGLNFNVTDMVSTKKDLDERLKAIDVDTYEALLVQLKASNVDSNILGLAGRDVFGIETNKSDFSSGNCGGDPTKLELHRRFQCSYGVNAAIIEYYVYASQWRRYVQKNVNNWYEDQSIQDTLMYLNKIQNDLGDKYYSILLELWTVKEENGDYKSLAEMLNPVNEGQVPDGTVTDTKDLSVSGDQILERFYVINADAETPIAAVNKLKIVDDIARSDSNVLTINELSDRVLNSGGMAPITEGEFDRVINDTSSASETVTGGDKGLTGLYEAVSYKAVTMSDYIVTGMTNSVSYVPMQTNLYAADTIASYDEDFLNEFFYKYGFMRKALLYDKSSTSAVDYYTANGKCTGQLKVVTLRDLIEMGDNDIALYVDDDFYNAEEAIEKGNSELSAIEESNSELAEFLTDYAYTLLSYDELKEMKDSDGVVLEMQQAIQSLNTNNPLFIYMITEAVNGGGSNPDTNALNDYLMERYNFDAKGMSMEQLITKAGELEEGYGVSKGLELTDKTLKNGDYTTYDYSTLNALTSLDDWEYRDFNTLKSMELDNKDSLVLPSSLITQYLNAVFTYETNDVEGEDGQITSWKYTTTSGYSPMLSLAYVSAIYRSSYYPTISDLVTADNPVFLASDDLCGLDNSEQWYCNTILNYAFVKNLPSACQINYSYVLDLDCPLYIDIFGNIQTESGTVVIPAANNMTLHPASYKSSNVGMGIYYIYGKDYRVPQSCKGASRGLFPFFTLDTDNECYIVSPASITMGNMGVKFDEIDLYASASKTTLEAVYKSYVKRDAGYTRLNWPAMVNIVNEVMRGSPIQNLDKGKEALNTNIVLNKAAITNAVKLENIIDSLQSVSENSLIAIPDVTKIGQMEYLVAFLIKLLIVGTCAVVIVSVYQDGVAGELGLHTVLKSLWSIVLTFVSVVGIPLVFQATYYTSNKLLLQNEAYRILLLNTEKYESGIELGMLETHTPKSNNDMAVQLDWITVPWYDELEYMLYDATLARMSDIKQRAYNQSVVSDHADVRVYNDGVYIETDTLFDSVDIDYTFGADDGASKGLYLHADNELQTAGWYMPYYVFLEALTQNVNTYNYYHDTYAYTSKYMSGNRLKTVGLSSQYFNSTTFAGYSDLEHISSRDTVGVDNLTVTQYLNLAGSENAVLDGADILHLSEIYNLETYFNFDVDQVFSAGDSLYKFQSSFWYNQNMTPEQIRDRIPIMNSKCRQFVANNIDMLDKLTDETFLKVMALAMAVEYNQLFNITTANSIDMYNLDTNDILRLCITDTDTAVLASPMAFSRFVYTFGGIVGIVAAALLEFVLFIGSFIKPLATIVTFVSVFSSIYVQRVVLRRKTHNLVGYLWTITLLCLTNFAHAILLKISMSFPGLGASTPVCIIVFTVFQIMYLIFLGYVVIVACKHWRDLGADKYTEIANNVVSSVTGKPNRNLYDPGTHHDDPWDYYNDLKKQHNNRNNRYNRRADHGYANSNSRRNRSAYDG